MGLCHFLLLHNYATCNIAPLPLLKIAPRLRVSECKNDARIEFAERKQARRNLVNSC